MTVLLLQQTPNLVGLGVGGMLALLILEKVFTFLARGKSQFKEKQQQCMYEWARTTHAILDQRGADGVPLCYVKGSLEEAIKQLTINLGAQTELLRELVVQVKCMGDAYLGKQTAAVHVTQGVADADR